MKMHLSLIKSDSSSRDHWKRPDGSSASQWRDDDDMLGINFFNQSIAITQNWMKIILLKVLIQKTTVVFLSMIMLYIY